MFWIVDLPHVPGKGSIGVADDAGVVYGPSTLSDCRRWIAEEYELRRASSNSEPSALRRAFG